MTAPAATQTAKPGAKVIRDALALHYRKPGADRDGEILIPEVEAPGSSRRADLVRVGMWRSRGAGIDVHEIKVSRGDWRRELDDPAKAEAWWPYSNRFWIVTPPGLIRPEELPAGWGLMEFPRAGRSRRFRTVVPAVTRDDLQLTVPLLVQLLRRADNQRLAQIDDLKTQFRTELASIDRQWAARTAEEKLPLDVRQRLDLLDQLETALGMPVTRWGGWPKTPVTEVSPGELAAFFRDVREHVTMQRRAADVTHLKDRLRQTATALLEDLDGA